MMQKVTSSIRFFAIFVVILPFSLELFIWALTDKFLYPDIFDYSFACLIAAGAFIFAILTYRSIFKAIAVVFALIIFLVVSLELNELLRLLFGPGGISHKIIRWGIGILMSFGIAYLSYRFVSYILKNKIFTTILTFSSFMMILINFLVLHQYSSFKSTSQCPNIILVVMDTARADHFSVYGYSRQTTPGLEWLSQDAAVYENAMSPAGWTPPGHASLFTGLLPAEHGTDGDYKTFDPPGLTLSEILREREYQTAAIVNNPMLDPIFGWNRGYDYYETTWNSPKLFFSRIVWMIKRRHKEWPWLGSTKRTLKMARRWWKAKSKHSKFLFVNLIDPHSPYGESHRFKDIFLDNSTRNAPDISNDSEDYDSKLVRAEGAALNRVIARYDGDIRFMDFCLESFFRWLEKRKELDHTLIILTSDHGERLGERGLLGHQLGLDNVLLHVPLIVRYPPRVRAGRFSGLIQTQGIYSTILDLVDLEIKGDGPEKKPTLAQPHLSATVAQMRHQRGYLEILKKRNSDFDPIPFEGNWNSVYDGTWKLHLSSSGIIRFFQMSNDPDEEKNIVTEYPEEAKRLLPYVIDLPDFGLGKKTKDIPEKVKKLLKSLGYIH